MEIERKFLISKFPDHINEITRAKSEQGYLTLEPQVRIRRMEFADGAITHILCIKGKGTLSRIEVETELSAEQYIELKSILDRRMITKDYRKYKLTDELVLECSLVNEGYPEEFMYAEIEFESEEQAIAYVPDDFLGEELTYSDSFRMSTLWRSMGNE